MRIIKYIIPFLFISCSSQVNNKFIVASEFDEQEYIWISWVETGFLGGDPFYYTAIEAIKEITPYCKVRLFYGPQLTYTKKQMKSRIYDKLVENKIDTSRVSGNEIKYGAIQDP
jgi:hypothetical protein